MIIYSRGGCKTLWKECGMSQRDGEAHFCPMTATLDIPNFSVGKHCRFCSCKMLLASVTKGFFEVDLMLLTARTLTMWESNQPVFFRGKAWFLGHTSLTLAAIMFAWNQLLLFSMHQSLCLWWKWEINHHFVCFSQNFFAAEFFVFQSHRISGSWLVTHPASNSLLSHVGTKGKLDYWVNRPTSHYTTETYPFHSPGLMTLGQASTQSSHHKRSAQPWLQVLKYQVLIRIKPKHHLEIQKKKKRYYTLLIPWPWP